MWKTVLRRVLIMIPQIIILSIIVFTLANFMPGDPFTGSFGPDVDPTQIEAMREAAGLNDPLPVQYVNWVRNALTGDFGRSFTYRTPVTGLIGQRFINSLRLGLVSTLITYIIAITFGVIAGRYNDSWFDRFVMIYNYVSFAIPLFVLALIISFIFGYRLGWFPNRGTVAANLDPGTWAYYRDMASRLVLPGFAGGILGTVSVTQILRSEVIDAKTKDYVRTARSKGVPVRKVYSKHILRNAFLPVASTIGFTILTMLNGSVFIETVFAYSGMGELFIRSITGRDYPVVVTLVLLFGIISIVGSLVSDIIMSLVDPRIRID